MKKYNMRINFFWDDEDDMLEFVFIVPNYVSIENIKETLVKTHHFLDFEDETDIYGINGRCPSTLIDYICEEYGWNWENFSFDIDMNFN